MNWKKALLSLLCAASLVLGLCVAGLPAAQAANEDVLFLALNDQMASPLSLENLPISVSGNIYVPYQVFDANTTGVDLGVYAGYSATYNRVTVYNKQQMLQYDLSAGGACTDRDGNTYAGSLSRGGVTYLPLQSVADFFGPDVLATIGYRSADYGTIIRVSSPNALLSDQDFFDGALSRLPSLLKEYRRLVDPSPSPSASSPSPPPPASPSPTVGEGKPDKSGVRVYLAFRCGETAGLPSILDTLDAAGVSALFLFPPEDLAGSDDLVRRMVASGHAVGLSVPGGPAEDAKDLLAQGSRLLELIAHTGTRTILVESGEEAASAALEGEGWAVWRGNVTASGGGAAAYAAALLQAVDAKRSLARVTLDGSAFSAAVLPRLLSGLREQNYSIRLAVDTELK